jgi:hypothetical protein
MKFKLIAFFAATLFTASLSNAQSCFSTSIITPAPFMGNNDEIFKIADGSLWQVKYEYSYLYEYYPTVKICPAQGKLLIGKSILNIIPISRNNATPSATQSGVKVIYKKSRCRDYFLADGDSGGIYVLEWYGGYDPDEGDEIVANLKGYGFKDVFYPNKNQSGKVYVDDYMLSRDRALAKMAEKCR